MKSQSFTRQKNMECNLHAPFSNSIIAKKRLAIRKSIFVFKEPTSFGIHREYAKKSQILEKFPNCRKEKLYRNAEQTGSEIKQFQINRERNERV
jgi:hypothetical protein